MKYKNIIAAVLIVVSMLLVTGCSKPAATESLKIAALKGPTGMGLAYVMSEKQAEFQVELLDAPDTVSGKFINGEIDIAAVPINLAAVLYNKTEGDAILIAVNTLGVLYVLDSTDSISSLADLAGRKIYATGQGSTPQYILEYLLSENGLMDAVEVSYIAEHASLAAMAASGEADLAMLPEPNVSAVLLKNQSAAIAVDLTEAWEAISDTPLLQGCYIVRRDVLETNRAAVQAFLAAAQDSAARVNSESGAAKLIAELGIVGSEAIAEKAIPNCNIVCLTGASMQESADAMLGVLFDANPKSVGGKLPDDSFYEIFE